MMVQKQYCPECVEATKLKEQKITAFLFWEKMVA